MIVPCCLYAYDNDVIKIIFKEFIVKFSKRWCTYNKPYTT